MNYRPRGDSQPDQVGVGRTIMWYPGRRASPKPNLGPSPARVVMIGAAHELAARARRTPVTLAEVRLPEVRDD